MGEQREGKKLVRFYMDSELYERFKLYCQLKGDTMTGFLTRHIESALQSENFSEILAERLATTTDREAEK
jgi:hypothetical protein